MEPRADLVEVVGSSHSPLPVIALEDIIAVGEFSWVSLGLLWLESISSAHGGIELKEVAIIALGRSEPLVVPRGVSVQSAAVKLAWGLLLVGSSREESDVVVDKSTSGDLTKL